MANVVDIVLPDDEQQGAEAVLERWLRQPGDLVRLHEPLLEINTDKAVVEVPAPASGVLREILRDANEPVAPGDIVGRIEVIAEGAVSAQPQTTMIPGKDGPSVAQAAEKLSPAVRELVKKHQIDLSKISGSGRDGRITHLDVENYLTRLPTG